MNKITFKNFLSEAAIDQRPQYDFNSLEEGVDLFFKHCTDAKWMITKNTPFFRGQREYVDGISVVDTSATTRESENTSNFYTLILDNVLDGDFPKRSRSFICTNDENTAKGYAHRAHGHTIIIPFNDTKIGIVGTQDMWNIRLKDLFGRSVNISDANDLLWDRMNTVLDQSNWKSFEKFDAKLKARDKDMCDLFAYVMARYNPNVNAEDYFDSFLENTEKAYTNIPSFKAVTTKTYPEISHEDDRTELWIGGKCLIMQEMEWEGFRKAVLDKLGA